MKSVKIEFKNIQSHAFTRFSLEPGLNFILANDNNVGKSTIFRVICTMTRMPAVKSEDLRELLREGETEGYAAFSYDNGQVILWLIRDAGQVRSFFEVRSASSGNIRMSSCPKDLLDALDIVVGDDGYPINFNDADSVQLIVQDTAQNDAVLSRVLVDDRIEHVRENAYRLDKDIVNDYKLAERRFSDSQSVLNNLSFNYAVDSFNEELDMLLAATRVTDCLLSGCDFEEYTQIVVDRQELSVLKLVLDTVRGCGLDSLCCPAPSTNDILFLRRVMDLTVALSGVGSEPGVYQEFNSELNRMQRAGSLARSLGSINFECFEGTTPTSPMVANMKRAVDTLIVLNKASACANSVAVFNRMIEEHEAEMNNIREELQQLLPVVQCPVRGRVFYSDEQCIPCSS